MTGEPKTFTVDGEIYSVVAELRPDPKDQCSCCRPLGHVCTHGVRVPSVTRPGITGSPVAGSIADWAHDVLHQDYRRDAGRKVRITLEILPAESDDPVSEQSRNRFTELTEMSEDPDWLGI